MFSHVIGQSLTQVEYSSFDGQILVVPAMWVWVGLAAHVQRAFKQVLENTQQHVAIKTYLSHFINTEHMSLSLNIVFFIWCHLL